MHGLHRLLIAATLVTFVGFVGPLWLPPLGHPLTVNSPFSLAGGPYAAGHRGIDLPARTGDTVRAPASGRVTFVGTVVDRPVLTLRIDARTLVSFEPLSSTLREGDEVLRGEVIGEVGTGGHCLASCLHLGARVDGEYVNPLRFLRHKPVLLPSLEH
ncbi:M23 family metallopeptidase [Leucobacter sp. W1153]|uniref:M23 family metallopeptidase n=1 Tax=Leucobacter sp. W1153 TaxID=3439064 RepID=UPI003F3A44FF